MGLRRPRRRSQIHADLGDATGGPRLAWSFVEVRVERSAHRVRLMPYGVHGRLRWRDLSHSAISAAPPGAAADGFTEWIVPMR